MTRPTPVLQVIVVVFSLLVAHLLCPPSSRAAPEVAQPVFHDFPMPESLTLCDEPVPLGNRWVRELLDRELTISAWDRAQVFMWLKRAGRYFPHIEKELAKAGMPVDIKYLAVAESSLIAHIRSQKGAVGHWQFMVHTARLNGLRKDRRMDERRDFERATEAALRYLKDLKETFGTWTLALAAYNCGGARLKKEIGEQKIRDYYRLNLPSETERFIFRIAAIKVIMENPERYGYRISQERVYRPIPCDTVPVKIGVPLHLTDLALEAGTDLKVLKDLNPQIIGYYLPKGRYRIKTPAGLGSKTAKAIKKLSRTASVPAGKVSGHHYVVQPGDTLSGISKKTGVSITTLRRLNGIEGSIIMVDQKLRLKP